MPLRVGLTDRGAVLACNSQDLGGAVWQFAGELHRRPLLIVAAIVAVVSVVVFLVSGPFTTEEDIVGGREAGIWFADNAPSDATFLAIGPSIGDLVSSYGNRGFFFLSGSEDPTSRIPPTCRTEPRQRGPTDARAVRGLGRLYRRPGAVLRQRLMFYVEKYSGTPVLSVSVDGDEVETASGPPPPAPKFASSCISSSAATAPRPARVVGLVTTPRRSDDAHFRGPSRRRVPRISYRQSFRSNVQSRRRLGQRDRHAHHVPGGPAQGDLDTGRDRRGRVACTFVLAQGTRRRWVGWSLLVVGSALAFVGFLVEIREAQEPGLGTRPLGPRDRGHWQQALAPLTLLLAARWSGCWPR